MKAIFYDNTETNVPGLVKDFHIKFKRGYAYETTTHFVHFYSYNEGWYGKAVNLCVLEPINQTLSDWVIKYFGAKNIETTDYEVGESVDGVWRPGLYFPDLICQALKTSESERKMYEQGLRVLIEKMDDIFLYIEPDTISLKTYSHKVRELLILACTEVESLWMSFINKANYSPLNSTVYTTKDYVKLMDILFLNEYECEFKGHSGMPAIKPFNGWSSSSPTKSLHWYDAYNKTKHNRISNFSDANLENVIHAVMACVILYVVKFGPFAMQEEAGHFNNLINQYFRFKLINSNENKHYIPLIEVPKPFKENIIYYGPYENGHVVPFKVNPLSIQ